MAAIFDILQDAAWPNDYPASVGLLRRLVSAFADAFSGKADKATTLAGYGIADARISGGVITLGPDSIAPLTSHQSLAAYVNGGSYDSASRKILLKHDDATVAEIDAAAFVRDGMVSSAGVVNVPSDETPAGVADGDYLKVTFNTDAGKDTVYIPLTDVFNPANYYDKAYADGRFVAKEQGKGLSTNDYDVTEKGKVATALQPADIVDPTTALTTGKAADAKATGDAMALRPTKAQLDAGWWSEWTILRNGVDVTSQVAQPVWDSIWDVSRSIVSGDVGASDPSEDENVPTLSWTAEYEGPDGLETVDYTAIRRRVSAPVPTKPEDIGAASVADATLTPIYSQTPTFSEWTFSGIPEGWEIRQFGYNYEGAWVLHCQTADNLPWQELAYGEEDAVSLAFGEGSPSIFATRVRTDIIGYTLGSQTDKPLQPQGDYALLAQLYEAVRNLAPDFTAKTYALNELCTYNGVFYRCKSTYTADAQSSKPDADTTHWEAKKVSELFLPLTGGTMSGGLSMMSWTVPNGSHGGVTLYTEAVDAYLRYSIDAQHSYTLGFPERSGIFAVLPDIGIPAFSVTATYALGAKVVHDNALWNCTTAVSTAGAWNAANWTKICDLAADATPTANSKALMTSGDIKTALDSKADAAALRYAANAATVPTGATPTVTNIADRAMNSATLGSGVTAVDITLPAATAGYARDFFVFLTVEASDAPTLTFTDPATNTDVAIAFGEESLADIDVGNNLILFTEVMPGSNKFLVSVKHEEAS